jgi:[ribosomal protein S5]-alanine N-acetyltransferase
VGYGRRRIVLGFGHDARSHLASVTSDRHPPCPSFAQHDDCFRAWQDGLPELPTTHALLRELRPGDSLSLFQAMSHADVSRFISPPPATLAGFEQFIAWSRHERAAGKSMCLGVVETKSNAVVGLFQVRPLEPSLRVAEWGFALAREYWGTGLFAESALRVLEFVFGELGVYRLEARAVSQNTRGIAALRKLGAAQECVLRHAPFPNGEHRDQLLWTLLSSDWARGRDLPRPHLFH